MADIRDLDEILFKMERAYLFDEDTPNGEIRAKTKAELEQLIKEKQIQARIEQIKSMVVTDSESDWDGNKLVWGYIDIRTDDINEVTAELEGEE